MKLARLLVGIGTCVFAMATSASAQIYIDGGMDSGPSLAQAKTAGTSKVERTFTITKTAGGGFPAGTYGCTAQISSAPDTCVHYTYVLLRSPNGGLIIAEDSEEPMCQVANLRAEVYLDENAPSGTYVCTVGASGNDYLTGGPISGYAEFTRYWGDGAASFLKSKGAAARFITPLKALDE